MNAMQTKLIAVIDESQSKLQRYTSYSSNPEVVRKIASEDFVILGMYKDVVNLGFLSNIYDYIYNSLREYLKILEVSYVPACTYLNAAALFHETAAEEFERGIEVATIFAATQRDSTFEEMCKEMALCSVPFLTVHIDANNAGMQRSILFQVDMCDIEIKSYSELLMYAAIRKGGYVFTYYSLADIKTGRQFVEVYEHNEKELSRQYVEMYTEYKRRNKSPKVESAKITAEALRDSFNCSVQPSAIKMAEVEVAAFDAKLEAYNNATLRANEEFTHTVEQQPEQAEAEKRIVSSDIQAIDDRLVEIKNIFILYVAFTLIMMVVAASYIAERLN